MFCQKCGNEIHDSAVVCVHCGQPTQNAAPAQNKPVAYCRNCGKAIDPHAVVCVHCGCAIAQKKEESNSTLLKVLSFLVPIAGVILYFVKTDDPHRGDYLKFAIASFVLSFIFTFAFSFLYTFLLMDATSSLYYY